MAAIKHEITTRTIGETTWRLVYYDIIVEPFVSVDLERLNNNIWETVASGSMEYQTGIHTREQRWESLMKEIKGQFEKYLNGSTSPQTECEIVIEMIKQLRFVFEDNKWTVK